VCPIICLEISCRESRMMITLFQEEMRDETEIKKNEMAWQEDKKRKRSNKTKGKEDILVLKNGFKENKEVLLCSCCVHCYTKNTETKLDESETRATEVIKEMERDSIQTIRRDFFISTWQVYNNIESTIKRNRHGNNSLRWTKRSRKAWKGHWIVGALDTHFEQIFSSIFMMYKMYKKREEDEEEKNAILS